MRAEMESSVEPRAGNELLTDYESVRALTMRSLFDMLDRSSEGTVVVDRDARIVWMNQHYAARFGFSDPQDAIGRDCEEVIPTACCARSSRLASPSCSTSWRRSATRWWSRACRSATCGAM